MVAIPSGLLFIGTVPLLVIVTGMLAMVAALTPVLGATSRYARVVGWVGTFTGVIVVLGGAVTGFIQGTLASGAYWLTALYLAPSTIGVTVWVRAYPGNVRRMLERVVPSDDGAQGGT